LEFDELVEAAVICIPDGSLILEEPDGAALPAETNCHLVEPSQEYRRKVLKRVPDEIFQL
jgi:hypothetical protein